MSQEVEVKILEIDTGTIIEKLRSLGAIETLYGTIQADFFSNAAGQKIRLRKVNDQHILTHKIVHANPDFIHNEEIELQFTDYEAMKNLLEALGFSQYGTSQKERHTFTLGNLHFDIDTLPGIPTFLEIESSSMEQVQEGVRLIGYSMEQTCTLTERTIKEHYGTA